MIWVNMLRLWNITKSMKDKQAAQTSSIVYAHLGYARILMQQNKQPEAILLLKVMVGNLETMGTVELRKNLKR